MPGDISKLAKIDMLEGKDPRKNIARAYREMLRMRERATLKRQAEQEIKTELLRD
jgi:hypothetical protein